MCTFQTSGNRAKGCSWELPHKGAYKCKYILASRDPFPHGIYFFSRSTHSHSHKRNRKQRILAVLHHINIQYIYMYIIFIWIYICINIYRCDAISKITAYNITNTREWRARERARCLPYSGVFTSEWGMKAERPRKPNQRALHTQNTHTVNTRDELGSSA